MLTRAMLFIDSTRVVYDRKSFINSTTFSGSTGVDWSLIRIGKEFDSPTRYTCHTGITSIFVCDSVRKASARGTYLNGGFDPLGSTLRSTASNCSTYDIAGLFQW